MITTLYNFAELLKGEEDLRVYYSPAENPFEGREDKGKVLVGIVNKGTFERFELEDFRESLINKYLYRKPAGSNGTNTIPTLYVNVKGPAKTSKKIRQSFSNYRLDFISSEDLERVITAFEGFDFDKNFTYIITFKIDGKYFGEFEEYKKRFEEEAFTKYYSKSYGTARERNKLCALSGEITTVYGFVDTLGFTVKAEAFRRNGFDAKQSYKMFPIAESTISSLEAARGVLIHKLAASFYGTLKYAIVPHFVIMPEKDVAKEIARKFLDKAAFNADSGEGKGSNSFINDTETILNEIIEDGDLKRNEIYYDILFFEQQQAQFKVHLELNDVLPSRIGKVLKAKEAAEDRYQIFTTYKTKDGEIKNQRITLYRLRSYFLTGEDKVQPAFNKLIQSIFTGQPYDDSKLVNLVVNTWKNSFKKNYNDNENIFNYLVRNTLGNLFFLNLLGIFKNEYIMSEITTSADKQDAFTFIEAHPAYFQKDYLKGAFIFGCLTARLLYNQSGNAFMKELFGLNIDKEVITKKFPKLIAKLRQYGKEFSEMEAAALRFFAKDEKVGKDEISFAFTMGLVLQKDFDSINSKIEEPRKKQEDQENK